MGGLLPPDVGNCPDYDGRQFVAAIQKAVSPCSPCSTALQSGLPGSVSPRQQRWYISQKLTAPESSCVCKARMTSKWIPVLAGGGVLTYSAAAVHHAAQVSVDFNTNVVHALSGTAKTPAVTFVSRNGGALVTVDLFSRPALSDGSS